MAPSTIDVSHDNLEPQVKLIQKNDIGGGEHVFQVKSSKLTNPSLQVTAEKTIKLVEAPVRKPQFGEVLIHIKTTGICGYVEYLFMCHKST